MPDDYAGVTDSGLLDLIATTNSDRGQPRLQIAFEHNDYEVLNTIYTDDKIVVQGGTDAWKERIVLDKSGQASFTRPYEVTQPKQGDYVTVMTVPWKQAQTYWVMERSEVIDQLGKGKLTDLEQVREAVSMISLADQTEEQFWANVDLANDRLPFGIKYYFPLLAAGQDTAGGWWGGCPAGTTTVAGILPSGQNTTTLSTTAGAKAMWNHYQAGGPTYYSGINETGIQTMRGMFRYLHFKPPRIVNGVITPATNKFRIYAGIDVELLIEQYLADGGDEITPDLATFNGNPVFKGVPIVGIDSLDGETYEPIWFINLGTFFMVVKQEENLYRCDPIGGGVQQHKVFTIYIDWSYNIVCNNRRLNGVMSKTA